MKILFNINGDAASEYIHEFPIDKVNDYLKLIDKFEIIDNDCKAVIEVGRKKIEDLETEIRNVAIEEYMINGVKDLGGVQIKVFTNLEYDEQAAVNYCLEHQHATLLKLDKRGFEKVAKELKPEFVKIEEVARAQIATDLSNYLEK